MKTEIFVLLIMTVFGSKEYENAENDTKSGERLENTENSIVVKIEEIEYGKKQKTSEYFGVTYSKTTSKWHAQRWSKNENNTAYNGCYDIEETAAHASDTLARKLMAKYGQNHMLNFPDDVIEVHKKRFSSQYLGVIYNEKSSRWRAYRWSQTGKKNVYNGYFDSEGTAASASDALARKLMKNGEQDIKVNFPNDESGVYPKEKTTSSKYFGVTFNKKISKWKVQRWSKHENKIFNNGYFENEEIAAHASDTLARQLVKKGEQGHKINFDDDDIQARPEEISHPKKKRKRKDDFQDS